MHPNNMTPKLREIRSSRKRAERRRSAGSGGEFFETPERGSAPWRTMRGLRRTGSEGLDDLGRNGKGIAGEGFRGKGGRATNRPDRWCALGLG